MSAHVWGRRLSVAERPVCTEPGWLYLSLAQWDLVCNSNKLKEMAQSVFMAGILVGGLVLGDLSDR